MRETALSGDAAAQAAATILRTRAEQAENFRQQHAHHMQTVSPLQQRRQELMAAREAERATLEQEWRHRDAEIVARYRVELERLNAQLQAAGI